MKGFVIPLQSFVVFDRLEHKHKSRMLKLSDQRNPDSCALHSKTAVYVWYSNQSLTKENDQSLSDGIASYHYGNRMVGYET